MILFVVNTRQGELLYRNAKNYYQKKGIPIQFYDSYNPKKDLGNLSKLSNILLQMINKIGGRSHLIEKRIADTIVIGMEFSLISVENGKRQCVAISCQHGPNLKNETNYATSNKVEDLKKQKIKGLD